MKIIHLISGPRNISTALMYSFAQRSDTKVVDEPFYGHYLRQTGAMHPGREEILQAMETDDRKVISRINQEAASTPVYFIKNMAHHLELTDFSFADSHVCVFLIREPAAILTSYHKVRSNPVLADIGLSFQKKMFDRLSANSHTPLVLDSEQVLLNPEAVLGKLCAGTGLPFEKSMLSWKSGPRIEDGIWAKYWYSNVHASTGFGLPSGKAEPLPESLTGVYEEAKPIYDYLYQFSIKA